MTARPRLVPVRTDRVPAALERLHVEALCFGTKVCTSGTYTVSLYPISSVDRASVRYRWCSQPGTLNPQLKELRPKKTFRDLHVAYGRPAQPRPAALSLAALLRFRT